MLPELALRGEALAVRSARLLCTNPGPRVTVEFGRGLTPDLMLAALREATTFVEAEAAPDQAAA